MSTIEGFQDMEETLRDSSNAKQMTERLAKIGGVDARDAVGKVLLRLMTNELMAAFNMKGNRGKKAFGSTTLLAVVKDSVMKNHDVSEHNVYSFVAKFIKYAPDRMGGGGRKKAVQN